MQFLATVRYTLHSSRTALLILITCASFLFFQLPFAKIRSSVRRYVESGDKVVERVQAVYQKYLHAWDDEAGLLYTPETHKVHLNQMALITSGAISDPEGKVVGLRLDGATKNIYCMG